MRKYIIGIDIGGTTYSSALFDDDYNIIKSSRKENVAELNSTKHFLNNISMQIDELSDKNNKGNITAIGVSCPGPLSAKEGIIYDTPNLKLLQNFHLKRELEMKCKLPAYINNDANLFALGEWFKAGANPREILGAVTLGTGLGFGIVINGQIYDGAHGMAAEYAISPVNSGNWENLVSIKAIQLIAIKNGLADTSPLDIYNLALDGNIKALSIWKEFGVNVGMALSHFINMIDPDKISIGGGISGAFSFFKDSMLDVVHKYSPVTTRYAIDIFESKDKEKSAQLGAAIFSRDCSENI